MTKLDLPSDLPQDPSPVEIIKRVLTPIYDSDDEDR